MTLPSKVEDGFKGLRLAARALRGTTSKPKNDLLLALAERIARSETMILEANKEDLTRLPADTTAAFRDRLTLDPQRLAGMVESLRQVAALPDPVGEVVEGKTLKNGLHLRRVRAPLGVVFMIFESRPNVVLEAFSLAFKTGNAIGLRGGRDSKATAGALFSIIRDTLIQQGLSPESCYGMMDYDRAIAEELLQRKDLIDIVVPRGGEKLIEFVEQTALMPIIKNDRGLCHTYVDDEADLAMAVKIVANAKTQRPGVCNSLETVLVHRKVADQVLPDLFKATAGHALEWRCDDESKAILEKAVGAQAKIKSASERDWDTEYLDQIMNCRIVANLDEAISHIEKHGSRHSEAIVTKNEARARRFQNDIDAAAVYWNASTRFTDGFEFGLGGELGISTQKLHVRGPVGLRELTTPRWIIDGSGQIRS